MSCCCNSSAPARASHPPVPEAVSSPAGAGNPGDRGRYGAARRCRAARPPDESGRRIGADAQPGSAIQLGARRFQRSNTISQRLNLITTELQEGVMKTRMQPIGLVWNKLPRIVRDLATSLGKEIDLRMEGAGTELDRTILEAIKDPLIHIVRNCCDHGIEDPGAAAGGRQAAHVDRLALRAYHEGGQVNIEIADDGAGIDPGTGQGQSHRARSSERRTGCPARRPGGRQSGLPARFLHGANGDQRLRTRCRAWTWSRPTSSGSAALWN